ncbi:MAG: nucleotidyltransferase domain-containing protein [Balneolaceae bacterium]|nr:nucleotidyltransferase domain-containing protein [Balneolaceae bacterium]
MAIQESIINCLEREDTVKLGILYGSMADLRASLESYIDLAAAADRPLSTEQTITLIECLADQGGRPVDLVDLQTTNGTLLKQILTTGTVVYCSDTTLYANIIKRMLFNDADMMPYYYRSLKEQREQWISE